MRAKTEKTAAEKESLGVADGLDFSVDIEESTENIPSPAVLNHSQPEKKSSAVETDINTNRNYSPYYTPKPKKGARGGTLGRGAVDPTERKVQFSMTCTPAQKERFLEAAQKEKRKLPDFICLAVEEYMENHNL